MRLIDASIVQEMLLGARDEVRHWTDKKLCELFLRLIVEQPTIDAVPVVRCKDCVYYAEDWCYHPRNSGLIDVLLMKETDFCSYGERKE